MTVTELLRLAPFSLGTITILLAAGGLIFGHAYGRYGEDAAISFLLRWRFGVAAALVFAAPALMLFSFGRGAVPPWLTTSRVALIVGLGVATAAVVLGYLLLYVSRPGRFLAAVGKRVTARRLNRYARATRWRDFDEFDGDISARRYEWFGFDPMLGQNAEENATRLRGARWTLLVWSMRLRRILSRTRAADPSEMLFDAAAAGLRNGNMRTWRSALEVIGRRLQGQLLEPAAARHVVANAMALEEAAHRQGSEDCKVRLCVALGSVGAVPMAKESAEILTKGISSVAERRLDEQRPVLAAIEALGTTARGNPIATVKSIGWLGQHLVSLRPPAAVYGFDGDRLEHPTRTLYAFLGELAGRADREGDGPLNDAIIDAGSMVVRKLPGVQDRETLETLGFAVERAGAAAARHYGAGDRWHGTHDAVNALVKLHGVIGDADPESDSTGGWIAEGIARIGCLVVPNSRSIGIDQWRGRADMAAFVAKRLLQLPHEEVEEAFVELLVRQHNADISSDDRETFMSLCQQMSGEKLGLRVFLEPEELASDGGDLGE